MKLKVLTAMGLILGSMSFSLPAHADTCVSSSEFGRIKNGMTEAQVKSLTGTNGTVFTAAGSGKYKIVIRSYKTCTKYGAVSISYMGGKLTSKSGVF